MKYCRADFFCFDTNANFNYLNLLTQIVIHESIFIDDSFFSTIADIQKSILNKISRKPNAALFE